MTLKSLLIISISLSLVLVTSTLYIADNTPQAANIEAQNSEYSVFLFNQSTNTSDDRVPVTTSMDISPPQEPLSNSPDDFQSNIKTGDSVVSQIVTAVVEIFLPDSNPSSTNSVSTVSEEKLFGASSAGPNNHHENEYQNGLDFYDLVENSPMSDNELQSIEKYSNGMNPLELINQFCTQVQNGEFREMTEDIRRSYNYDPASPAILMDAFESMSELCPIP